MSYLPLDQLAYKDGPSLDAFGRLRISDSNQLFGGTQEYTFHPLIWDHYSVTGGTIVYTQATSSSQLNTNVAADGARAIRQTKAYYRYIPGKSHAIKLTGTLRKGAAPSGAAFAGLGYYDDNNGMFFRETAAGVQVVLRSNTSGSVVDEFVSQANWNLDKMDGTGASGITLDFTKEQVFTIDLQWLGVGRVRFGVSIDGLIVYVHQFLNANTNTTCYTRTACLPVRYEVFNSGGAGSAISVEALCATVESEGGRSDPDFYPFAYSAYVTPMSVDTTLRPVVSRRLRDTFQGATARGHAHPRNFMLLVKTNDIYWELRYNATVVLGGGGSATTNNVDVNYSQSEFDTYAGANNTVTGGVLISSGYSVSGSGSTSIVGVNQQSASSLILGRTYANVRDQLTLSARSMSGSASLSLAVNIEEQY